MKKQNKKNCFLKKFLKQIKNKTPKGNTIAISITMTSFLLIATVNANVMINSSLRSSQNVEKSNNAFLSAESGIEIALYDVIEHSNGYEVGHNFEEDDYSCVNLEEKSQAKSWWSVNSLDTMRSATNNKIIIPAQKADYDVNTPSEWNWSESSFGSTKALKLYVDNTSLNLQEYNCSDNADNDGDGNVDCDDQDCKETNICLSAL